MTRGGFTDDQFAPIRAHRRRPRQARRRGRSRRLRHRPIVISHRIWRSLFNGDEQIVGKPIRFAELPGTIVGVAHPDFDTPHDGGFLVRQPASANDVNHGMEGFMRIKPARTTSASRAEMAHCDRRRVAQGTFRSRRRTASTSPSRWSSPSSAISVRS